MLPTLVGISFVVWLLMVAAPGRPGEQAQAFGDVSATADPTKEREKGESQRLFRRQFALDRPTFWNPWTGLDDAEVIARVKEAAASIETVGAEAKRRAREVLEDWGYYAVPGLVRALRRPDVTGDLQSQVLAWLRLDATRSPVKPYGRVLDEATRRRNEEWAIENQQLASWKWSPEDGPDRRAQVVKQWSDWFEANRSRWDWTGWERLKVGLTDTQFATYWGNLLRLDFGISHVHKRPVVDLLKERVPVTACLALVAIALSFLLAIPLGIYSAVRPYTFSERTVTVGVFVLYSIPSFVAATVLLYMFTIGTPFKWFPNSGWRSAGALRLDTWSQIRDVLWHVTLPLVVMTYSGLAILSRFARGGMLDVIRSDYIRTARAKGLPESAVVFRHAARNGMMPIVTVLGGILPTLITGSILVEYVFNIQGMGLLTIDAINNRDYNVVMAEALVAAVLTLVGILAADIGYAILDPRISFS
jgi:peptide/nickel transport system permease protein